MTMASRIAVMNKGVLQQLDTPQNLYDKPNNLFVAGFIGTPAMNFFKVKLEKDGDAIYAVNKELKVRIPPAKAEKVQKLVGKDVIMGIRPDDIHNPEFSPSNIHGETVEAKVEVTELMGNEILIYLNTGSENSIVARVDPRSRYSFGDKVQVLFNMDNSHIFDPSVDAENPVAVR
jgi:multiple sugar transport system ATP-binding protein